MLATIGSRCARQIRFVVFSNACSCLCGLLLDFAMMTLQGQQERLSWAIPHLAHRSEHACCVYADYDLPCIECFTAQARYYISYTVFRRAGAGLCIIHVHVYGNMLGHRGIIDTAVSSACAEEKLRPSACAGFLSAYAGIMSLPALARLQLIASMCAAA